MKALRDLTKEAPQPPTPRTGGLRPPLAVLVLFVLGCGQPDPAHKHLAADQLADFHQLFSMRCAGCHGAEGKHGPAPALHDELFLATTPDSKLEQTILSGRPGTLMPAFGQAQGGPLKPLQVQVLVKGLRGWGGFDAKLTDSLVTRNPSGDWQRGEQIFSWACAHCHGDQGKGYVTTAQGKQATEVGAINDPAFLSLVSEDFLRRIVITGRPDITRRRADGSTIHMLSYRELGAGKKALQPQEVADLAALLIYWKRSS